MLASHTGTPVPSSYLLKHHHLAPRAFSKGKLEQDISNDDALLWAESWESEIVVTTFVQLFESLVGSRNRSLKKLHNIAGSIIILDEIQSIPREQWELIGHTLTTLSEHLGCTVLQMTATKPRILPAGSTKELLPDPERYFRDLTRTYIIPRQDVTDVGNASAFIEELSRSDASVLAVFNTVRSSVDVYTALKNTGMFSPYREYGRSDRGAQQKMRPLFYLSTNLTPWQRARRVRLLKKYIKAGGKPVVISTQVIEAGVDLDFDTVIRDRGPLDSIVQVAGRCNRSGTRDKPGNVFIINLKNDGSRDDAELVYGNILPGISGKIISADIEESQLYEKLDDYFSLVVESTSGDKSVNFIEAIRELRFGSEDRVSVGDYRHVESLETMPVIVEINSEAISSITNLESCLGNYADRHKMREAYRRIGPFVITPSRKRVESNLPPEHPVIESHRYINYTDIKSDPSIFYDMETGFLWDGPVAAIL